MEIPDPNLNDPESYAYCWKTSRYASKIHKNDAFSVEEYFEAKMPREGHTPGTEAPESAVSTAGDGELDDVVSFLAHDTSLIAETK